MPTLEDALAVTVIVPFSAAPLAGEVMETVGGVVVLFTVMETPALVVFVFAVSVATAVTVCLPLLSVVVFSDCE
jgi:hypothetical protein